MMISPIKAGKLMCRFFFGNCGGTDRLRDIDWLNVYAKLGMAMECEETLKSICAPKFPVLTSEEIWVVPVVEGITCNNILLAFDRFGIGVDNRIGNIEKNVFDKKCNSKNGSYLVGFRRRAEADEENSSLSGKELEADGHEGITLLERLLLGLGYLLSTWPDEHLDQKNVTLCTGSRLHDGSIPKVFYNPASKKIEISGVKPNISRGYLCSRSVLFFVKK